MNVSLEVGVAVLLSLASALGAAGSDVADAVMRGDSGGRARAAGAEGRRERDRRPTERRRCTGRCTGRTSPRRTC